VHRPPLAETEARAPPAPPEPVALHSLAEIAGLAGLKGAAVLKVQIENHMHSCAWRRGKLEFRPRLARHARLRPILRRSSRNGPESAGW